MEIRVRFRQGVSRRKGKLFKLKSEILGNIRAIFSGYLLFFDKNKLKI